MHLVSGDGEVGGSGVRRVFREQALGKICCALS